MRYFYKPRHNPAIPTRRRRLPFALGAAAALAAGSLAVVATMGDSAPPPAAASAQTLVQDQPAAASPSASAAATPSAPAKQRDQAAPPAQKDLSYQFAWQENYYFCGPAATRIALTARGLFPTQSQVAGQLGTTVNGTNSADDTTRTLNFYTGSTFYKSHFITGQSATPADVEQLQGAVVNAISHGYVVVANIAGSTTDEVGHGHSYPGGHYLTVVGYSDAGKVVKIADPADAQGVGSYQLTVSKLADWVAQRGYSA